MMLVRAYAASVVVVLVLACAGRGVRSMLRWTAWRVALSSLVAARTSKGVFRFGTDCVSVWVPTTRHRLAFLAQRSNGEWT